MFFVGKKGIFMIYMLLADGFEEIEALTPLDLLRRAGKEILTVSITSERAVTGAHGITVLADLTKDTLTHVCDEMLILPGGMPGTKNLDASPITDRLIEEAYENITVPVCFEEILRDRGVLGDPYFSTNCWEYAKFETHHQWYFKKFDCPFEKPVLRFEGIDTIAEIYVNGILVGKTDNMY